MTEEVKKRTSKQNRALHLYFRLVAEALNDAGFDMRRVLKEEIEIPWSPDMVKKYLWKSVQEIELGKQHTAELNSDEIDVVWETLNRHLAKFGIAEPFPSIETLIEKSI